MNATESILIIRHFQWCVCSINASESILSICLYATVSMIESNSETTIPVESHHPCLSGHLDRERARRSASGNFVVENIVGCVAYSVVSDHTNDAGVPRMQKAARCLNGIKMIIHATLQRKIQRYHAVKVRVRYVDIRYSMIGSLQLVISRAIWQQERDEHAKRLRCLVWRTQLQHWLGHYSR